MKTALGLQAVEVDEAVEVGGAERTLLKALELGVNSGRCRVRCSSRCCWEEWRVRWQSQYSRSAAPCYPPLFPEYFRLGDTITRDKAEAWQQGGTCQESPAPWDWPGRQAGELGLAQVWILLCTPILGSAQAGYAS